MKPIDLFRAGFWKQTSEQIIQSLFAQGQQGFWLPFTDFASLSQDSAGTLPYTALEQPVGRVLDRSGRGNHATQATSTARGAVSARVNLLTKTNQIGGVAWNLVNGISVTLGASQGPRGSASMSRLTVSGGTPNQRVQQNFPTTPNAAHTVSLVIKKESESNSRLAVYNSAVNTLLCSTTIVWTGSDPTLTNNVGWISAPVATNLGGGNFLVSGTFSPSANTHCACLIYKDGSIGDSVLVGGAEIKLASQAALPYQSVNTPTDYDSVGFPKYLRLDGTDDFYTCGGGGSTTGFYYSDVIRPMGGAGTARFLLSDRIGGLTGYMVSINTTNKLELALGGGGTYTRCASTDSIDVGTQYFIEAFDDGVNLQVAVNGGTPVTVPRPATPTYGGSAIMLYKNTIANDAIYNGQITEPIYRAGPPPNAHERGVIRAYQMQKAGML